MLNDVGVGYSSSLFSTYIQNGTAFEMSKPRDIALDANGNLYIT
jgi:hypothetical protein